MMDDEIEESCMYYQIEGDTAFVGECDNILEADSVYVLARCPQCNRPIFVLEAAAFLVQPIAADRHFARG